MSEYNLNICNLFTAKFHIHQFIFIWQVYKRCRRDFQHFDIFNIIVCILRDALQHLRIILC